MEPGESEREHREGARSRASGGPRRLAAFWVALALGAIPLGAGANDSGESRTGQRVRVTQASSGERVVGRLLQQTDQVLVLEKGSPGKGDPVRIQRSDVAHFEVSVRPGRKRMGAGIGALAGVLAAVAIGASEGGGCAPDAWICFSETETAGLVGVLTIPAGALIGALVAPGEKWETESPSRLAVGVAPAPGGGVAARVALSF
jgi:hypothetical protein